MEKIVEQALLYDFYGELLNEHQRKVYEDAIFNDLSFSEIADEYGISRQGVFDLIKRVNKTLANYESKLHLIEKFQETKTKVARIDSLADSYLENNDENLILDIKKISKEILDEF
ncbi:MULTISPECIES: YlxM family DNA-binding protein [Lachnospira]|jgi:predicted DNA-binding protein YlxM (UPF0122 family)|uniref:UPF0122 protein SAMN05216537_101159 n=2 Tax=Lachnospira TaxID=28050 RepID=A0A1H5RM56_9FIRM|nr:MULTISPECIES: hypothetical protein [Lachnospira]MBQ2473306.1 DNA-binding protein [Lachnospira sp.]MCR5515546.1 DNA-binding protein [Lachnospira sp.]SDM72472.1 hypothetical protein SAMN05216544_0988 [Lachnospira pectinoschiza]SEF39453.1 hypothetical protein SAMN05216537_101159 [Lachnospira multipara]